jgi:DNA-binding winged helix-turn-helix (wHTH) protein
MRSSSLLKLNPTSQLPSQRRSKRQDNNQVEQTTVWLNLQTQELWRNGVASYLRPKTFSMLQYLMRRPGQLISHSELRSAVWPDTVISTGVLKNCILELRQALADSPQNPRFIEVIRRHGYRLLVPLATTPLNRKDLDLISSGQKKANSRQQTACLDSQLTVHDRQPLVGRREELARLHHWWDKALRGHRQIVFLKGEAGMGKTALTQEFLRQVENQHPLMILQCHSAMQYGEQEPYLPLLEAFSRLARTTDTEFFLDTFRRHAPLWLAQMPSLLTAAERQWLQREVLCATPQRMLREGSDIVEALSTAAPLIVVLENLHWSEHATLNLLSFIAQRQESARLLVLSVYRPEENVENTHVLREIVQELNMHQHCQTLSLKPLPQMDVKQYLELRFAAEKAAWPLALHTLVEWVYY